MLWQWQTGAAIQAPPSLYGIDGVQYVAVLAGGPTGKLADSTNGDAVWVFSLDGNLAPFGVPEPPLTSVGGFETRAITATNRVTSVDFAFMPNRVQIKAGDTLTFTNNGPQPHTATSHDGTGLLAAGASYALTFDQPGTYVYNCTPHPYMVGQIRVADADGNVPVTAPDDPDTVHP